MMTGHGGETILEKIILESVTNQKKRRKEVRNMTKTYFVTFDVVANVTFEVEAHDSEEAKEIANRLNVRDLQEVNEIKTCESRMEVYESDY